MRTFELYKIDRLTFGYEEIARVLGISLPAAKVSAHRYSRMGFLIRLKPNKYILRERWQALEKAEKFRIANLILVPSYVSLMSALEYYQITTQVQRDFVESIALRRSKEVEVAGTVFTYSKIKAGLYNGFRRQNEVFIATPEKAFWDAVYLSSLGRYSLDWSSLDFGKLDEQELQDIGGMYPEKAWTFYRRFRRAVEMRYEMA